MRFFTSVSNEVKYPAWRDAVYKCDIYILSRQEPRRLERNHFKAERALIAQQNKTTPSCILSILPQVGDWD